MTDPKSAGKTKVSASRLVHFFGPDGSGKTTQARMLTDFLKDHGVPAKKCWVRGTHTLAFVIWHLLIKIGFYRVIVNQFGVTKKVPAVYRNRFLKIIWSGVEFLGVLPWVLRIRFLMLRGYKVVAERYILDTAVSIAYTLEDAGFLTTLCSRILFCFIPKDTALIFLDSDYRTILCRRRGRVDEKRKTVDAEDISRHISASYVEPEEMIGFQRTAYKKLATSFNALVIDTSRNSVEETSNQISKYLGLQ